MKCADARKLVEPYLDSELDTETTFEVERHLETCEACSQFFSREQEWTELLQQTLRHEGRSPDLWEEIETRIRKPRIWRRLAQRLTVLNSVILVGVIGGLAATALLSLRPEAAGGPLVTAVEECHQAYLNGIVTADFHGAIPTNFVQRLKGNLEKKAFKYLPEVS